MFLSIKTGLCKILFTVIDLRYEEHLKLEYEINVDPEQWMVPFNWLMPLVENAFIHGMKEVKEKRIWIHASEEEGWLHVLLGNNGKQMEETQLRHFESA